MYKYLLIILITLVSAHAKAQPAQVERDSFHIFFRLDDPNLNEAMQYKIDSLLRYGLILRDKDIIIVGYADYLGTTGYNEVLSQNRAMHVKEYLAGKGVKSEQIKICMGKGQIKRNDTSKLGYAPDRKVDIVIERAQDPESDTPTEEPDNVITFKKKQKKTPAKVNVFPGGVPVNPSKTATATPPDSQYKLDKYKPGETFVLNKIFFEYNRHIITKESVSELDNLYNALAKYPNIKIQIEGHICCIDEIDALDDDTHELALSVNRAKYIYEYLISRGINADRMKYIGYGRTRPMIKVERSRDDQAKNRRVEIRILEK
ncbi:MAG: OmpA family protein [Bacteroidota bacterium]